MERVRFRYPDGRTALDGIDLEVGSGASLGISGPNGSGKSTLLRHLNGLLRPTSGRVVIGGQDAGGARVGRLARVVGLVFQEPEDQLFRSTVAAEVAAGAGSARSAEHALELVGLGHRSREHPQDLGYSRRKLLCIAAVLAMETPVLVLDEPTAGQDADGRSRVATVVREALAQGRTVIVAGHDRAFMAAELDRQVALVGGRLATS